MYRNEECYECSRLDKMVRLFPGIRIFLCRGPKPCIKRDKIATESALREQEKKG